MAELTDTQLLDRFADGMKQARAAAKLLAFSRQSDEWLTIEKLLEKIAHRAGEFALQSRRGKLKLIKPEDAA